MTKKSYLEKDFKVAEEFTRVKRIIINSDQLEEYVSYEDLVNNKYSKK